MRIAALILVLCALSQPAFADQIAITAVCSELPGNEPEGIEEAEYKPGVDVNGKPVAPADLNQPVKAINYPIQVPIEIDVLELLELEIPASVKAATDMESRVAYATLYEDGRVEYNGQNISQQVTYKCQDTLPKLTDVEPQPPVTPPAVPAAAPAPAAKAGGQTPAEPVASEPAKVPQVNLPVTAPKPAEAKSKTESPVKNEQTE